MEKDIKNIGIDIPNLDEEALILANEICEKQFEIMELQKKQLIVQEYKNSTDMKLVEFAGKFMNGQNKEDSKSKFEMGVVSEKQSRDIKRVLVLNIDSYCNVICADVIRHIDKRHGCSGTHDKSVSDIEDFGRIKYCLDNYDSIRQVEDDTFISNRDGSKAKAVEYKKRINGTVVIIQVAPNTHKQELIIRTMYKEKATAKQSPIVEDERYRMYKPPAYARDESLTSSTHSIPQPRKKVKPLNKKDRGDIER